MKRTLSKSLTWLLTLLMLLTALPVNGLSEALVSPAPTTEATPVPAEDEGAVSATPAPAEDAQTDEGDEPEETPADVAMLRLTEENGQLPVRDGAALYAVRPEDGTKYRTYRFYAEEKLQTLLSEQIVKEGDTLYEPKVTAGAHQKFVRWEPSVSFGTVGAIAATETIDVYARFEEVYYVFFKDNNGRVIKTVEGKAGDMVSAAGVSFPVGSDESITGWKGSGYDIAADGSVKIAGDDITLTAVVTKGHWITFESDGGSYVAPQFVTGATTEPAKPTKAGYTFAGWTLNGSAFAFGNALTENITLKASWTANSNTSYTVIHWQENANDDGYSYKESETLRGTTGAQTSAGTKSYPGFTAQTITQEIIAGDGSTIVNVYYKRNVYEVKFFSYSSRNNPSREYTQLRITAKYGASIGDKWPTYNGSSAWAVNPNDGPYQANIDTMPLGGANFYGPNTDKGSETAYYYVEVLPGESGTWYNGVQYKE
ncbi:MAG: InlB B-repeat-containing protein, partial [Clostridiales bacterium]|nr:InlB B-repeat-containing protein [Clostridiales bacterium]